MFRGDLGSAVRRISRRRCRTRSSTAPRLCRIVRVHCWRRSISTAARTEAEQKAERKLTDQQFASYLMYPKVFLDWNAYWEKYGDVERAADAGIFLRHVAGRGNHGRQWPGQNADRALTSPSASRTRTASRTVFFELNGQPRSVNVADRALTAGPHAGGASRSRQSGPRRRADAGHGRDRCGQTGRRS